MEVWSQNSIAPLIGDRADWNPLTEVVMRLIEASQGIDARLATFDCDSGAWEEPTGIPEGALKKWLESFRDPPAGRA